MIWGVVVTIVLVSITGLIGWVAIEPSWTLIVNIISFYVTCLIAFSLMFLMFND